MSNRNPPQNGSQVTPSNQQSQIGAAPNDNQKAVFPVIKNPSASNKPIPYTVDPY